MGRKSGMTVSVVVPCKNDARYLTANLESILSQDYPDVECIVVDGGSTDATVDLLKRYGDRIRWVSEPDRGAFDAINRGWQLANGEVLAWLNADDLWEPGAVSTAVEFLENQPDVDVVYGTARVVDELGRTHGELVPRTWDLEHALRNCDHIIFQPASFVRRRILEEVGGLYPAWCHDHDLWLRIARADGTFARIPACLAVDRLRFENLGRVADIVIPSKIGLTKRFFAEPALPPHIKGLRRRAMSNAYLRCIDYLRGEQFEHWLWGARLLTQALVADPLNVRTITKSAALPLRARSAVLLAKIRLLGAGVREALLRLARFPLAALRQVLGRILERLFTRGNRELGLKVQHAIEEVKAVQARVDLQHIRLREILESLQRKDQFNAEIYGTPPTLRRIPGWHTYWGVEDGSDRLLKGRIDLWSSLERPVLMRWLDDLLVMIRPGNELSRVLFLTGNFEPNELTWLTQAISEGMTIVDVGAHMGIYSMIASRLVGESGVVIAIEPSTREFQRLAFHVGLNNLTNVRCLQEAASDASGEAALKIASEWNSGHNTFGEFFNPDVEKKTEERVRTRTIDAIVAAQQLERVDLIKVDVEGHELNVLTGAAETLARFRSSVLIEVFGETLRRQGASVEAVLDFLVRHGYALYEFSASTGELVPLSQPFGDESRNLVALPE
jgi:FkbM family methyltransferase